VFIKAIHHHMLKTDLITHVQSRHPYKSLRLSLRLNECVRVLLTEKRRCNQKLQSINDTIANISSTLSGPTSLDDTKYKSL